MSDEDIDKAVREAAEYEAQDKKRKDAIDTRNDADSMVFQTEKAMEEVGDKLDPNDKSAVEADIQVLKDAGVNGVLIGETLMRSPDKAAMLAALNGGAL